MDRASKFISVLKADLEDPEVEGEELFKAQCKLYNCQGYHGDHKHDEDMDEIKLPNIELNKSDLNNSIKKNNYHENFVKIDVTHSRRKSLVAIKIKN